MNERRTRALTWIGLALYSALGIGFVALGRVNGDEGWYLETARRVYRGELPFVDFAFTQMPLTPYVYGLPQLFGPSLTLGRVTSLVFAVAAAALCLRVARHLGGWGAAALTGFLLLAFPTGLYFQVLVKTYALTAFCFSATLAALTSKGRHEVMRPLAVTAATALALTRTSGLPFAIFTAVYCVWAATTPTVRARCLGVAAVGTAVAAAFLLADPEAVRFELSTIHQSMWHGASLDSRLGVIATKRLPQVLACYAGFALLGVAGLACVVRSGARVLPQLAPSAVVFLGVGTFLAAHLLPGQFSPYEYFVPGIPVLLVLAIVPLVNTARNVGSGWARPALGALVTLATVATLVQLDVRPYVVAPGGPGSIAAVKEVATFLAAETRPEDEVLALWSLDAVVVADRRSVPEVSLGLFSYWDLPTARARDLHFLNPELLLELVRTARPAAVVLTDLDRGTLRRAGVVSKRPGAPEPIFAALERRYTRAFTGRGFGMSEPVTVEVYLRR